MRKRSFELPICGVSLLTSSVGGMNWEPVLEAVGQAVNGRSEAAKAALEKCWDEAVEEDHAQRCVLAHYLADQQENLQSETRWDEQALTEFTHLQDGDLAAIGVPSTAGFAPSLHLNLGDDYLRAGRVQDAEDQVVRAQQSVARLPEQGYGAMIRDGVRRLQGRVEAANAAL